VNKTGYFNVPFGDKKNPQFPTANDLGLVSKALRNSSLIALDYESVLKSAQKGDFVYLDPPYPPLNGTSYFTHYTQDRFNASNQECLAEVVRKLDRKGCLIMMSNADTAFIKDLYKEYNIYELMVTRYVTCKNIKHRVGELVITNYDGRH
jgi:DNA adenine methylase